MRSIFLLPILALAPVLPAQIAAGGIGQTSQTSILLLIEGTTKSLTVTRAWRKSVPFQSFFQDEKYLGEIVLHDLRGNAVFRQRVDLSDFLLAGAKDEVLGDIIREGRIAILAKVPDLGQRLSSLRLRVRQGKTWTEVGKIGAAALNQLLLPQLQPQVPTVKTHLKSGPVKNRYDIVIIGDGYQATEQARFYADIARWMKHLFAYEPYKTYKPFFNVHSVFSASKESGADHPDKKPPIVKNTVYDASYYTGRIARCLYIKNGRQALTDAALAPDVEGRIVVFVNDSRYGGCAGTFAVSYNGGSGPAVQSHEFGHSFGRLADEYNYGRSGTYTGGEPGSANVTADKTGKTKWPLWMGYKGIGVYEGAGYYKKGLYRSEPNCMMRSLSRPLCHVCIEQSTKMGYLKVNPIENPAPAPGLITLTVPAKQTVSFTNLVPAGGKIEWKVGGKLVQTGGTSFILDSSKIPVGLSSVDLILTDTTLKTRKGTPVRTATWPLKIVDPTAADLAIKSFTVPASAANGNTIALVTTIENRGKTASVACKLEHFAAMGLTAGPGDTYLGSVAVAAIGPGRSVQIKRSIAIPYLLLQGKASILAYADRAQVVKEGNRSNNQVRAAITLTAPSGCPASLEFSDKMIWPITKANISITGWGVRTMTVTATCNKGDWALVLWSTKGTSPGMRFGTVSIPLNFDPVATPFALATGNSGPFYFFLSRIDSSGQTTPMVILTQAYNLKAFTSHFAAVVIKSDFSTVLRASNPVQLDFVK